MRTKVWPRRAVVYNWDDSMPGTQTLHRRLVKLETLAAVRQDHMEPVYSEEDRAILQRIVSRMYADPVRNAKRIAIFEQARVTVAARAGENRHG